MLFAAVLFRPSRCPGGGRGIDAWRLHSSLPSMGHLHVKSHDHRQRVVGTLAVATAQVRSRTRRWPSRQARSLRPSSPSFSTRCSRALTVHLRGRGDATETFGLLVPVAMRCDSSVRAACRSTRDRLRPAVALGGAPVLRPGRRCSEALHALSSSADADGRVCRLPMTDSRRRISRSPLGWWQLSTPVIGTQLAIRPRWRSTLVTLRVAWGCQTKRFRRSTSADSSTTSARSGYPAGLLEKPGALTLDERRTDAGALRDRGTHPREGRGLQRDRHNRPPSSRTS